MTTQPSFINIEYVGSPLMESTMWTPVLQTEHKKSGGIGTILGVVASIAVPFFAPMIATAVFGGASILGSALTGAALGAGTAALTGRDPLTGALMGGIGAGFSSYMAGNGLFTDPITGATNNGLSFGNATTAQPTYGDPNAVSPVTTMNFSGQLAPNTTDMILNPNADLAAVGAVPGSSVSPTAGLEPGAVANAAQPSFTLPSGEVVVSPSRLSVPTGIGPVNTGLTASLPPGYSVEAGNVLQGPINLDTSKLSPFYGNGFYAPDPKGIFGFGGIPPNIPKFITDSANNVYLNPGWQQAAAKAAATSGGMTDALIRGGVNLAGMAVSQLAPNPQQEIADKYAAELSRLKKTDQAGYEAKKKEVEGLIASAKAMDPAYFGQQAANAAKISGTRGLMESFREMPMAGLRDPAFTSAETRRANIGIGQNVGTAYDQGFGTGLTARQSALSSAINQMPNSPSRYLEGLRSMAGMQDNANRYGSQSAQGYSNMFGTLARPFMTSQV